MSLPPRIQSRTGRWQTPVSAEQRYEHIRRHPCGLGRTRLILFRCDCGDGGSVELCTGCKTVVISHSPRGSEPCRCIREMVA